MSLRLKIGLSLALITSSLTVLSQQDTIRKSEIGVDGFFSISNMGGSFTAGLKYGIVQNKKVIFGPSVRLQRSWSNYNGQKYGFNIYGAGAFCHYRLQNVCFVGAEFEMLRSPYNFNFVYSLKHWVATLFVGGGYSHEFERTGFRLNAGVYYDVVNSAFSPFQTSYVLKNANGNLLPVIYRVALFFPLN